MKRYCLLKTAICIALLIAAPRADADEGKAAIETKQLTELLAEHWEVTLRESPLFATRVGDHRYNDRLGFNTPADIARQAAQNAAFLNRLKKINRTVLPRGEQINYDIFARRLNQDLQEHRFKTYLTPITNRWGFHVDFPELPKRVPLATPRDYENYIARLRAFRRYMNGEIALMREGIEQGFTLPAVVLEGYADTITPHIVDDVEQSLLYTPFARFPAKFSEADQKRLRSAGSAAINESVLPGYRDLLKFMRSEYLPAARGSIAASALPDGRAFYRHRVQRFTTLDLSPEQVHSTGLAEVARIRKEMEGVAKEAGFEGDVDAMIKFLRTDEQFYAKSPEELMKEVAYVLKRMDGQLPKLFNTLPRTPYGIRRVPAYIAPKTTTAYYTQPRGDGGGAGFYYVNTYNLKSRPLFEVEALSLHEAVPGHHLQLALQQELKSLPSLRRYGGFTAFVEGWALYAERLGLEVGFYKTPSSNFGRLSYEMWRACRLVVDTGIHYLGWTRQQAIDYMAKNTALSLHNIEAEVDRYISWPGQALAYKTGELKIRALRAEAEQSLGDKFDLREFHDVVLLSGATPLDILEENVRNYIERRRQDGEQSQ